jgi:hypothetical protein
MQDLIDNALIGVFLFFIGFAFIYKRGFSYWLRGKTSEYPPNYFRVVDLIGGIIFCVVGLILIARAIVLFFRH